MWCRVLLVDDEIGVLNALRRELLRPPHISPEALEIESFANPTEAMARVRGDGGDFDIAIVDYRMPKLDGVAFLCELHAIRPDAIRILLTGTADAEAIGRAINDAQIDVLLFKPWHEFDLKGRVALGLHLRQIKRQRAVGERKSTPRQGPYELMIVDDEASILSALEREICHGSLATAGDHRPLFHVTGYTSAQEALEAAADRPPDLVVADWAMPGLDGITFLHRLREVAPDSVRILMSGGADVQMLSDAVNVAGIYHFLAKPWQTAELKSMLMQALVYRQFLGDEGSR